MSEQVREGKKKRRVAGEEDNQEREARRGGNPKGKKKFLAELSMVY